MPYGGATTALVPSVSFGVTVAELTAAGSWARIVEPSESLSGCVIGASAAGAPVAAAGAGAPAVAKGAKPKAIAPLTSRVPVTADHRLAAIRPVTCRRLTLLVARCIPKGIGLAKGVLDDTAGLARRK
jgi:hypothetical protein